MGENGGRKENKIEREKRKEKMESSNLLPNIPRLRKYKGLKENAIGDSGPVIFLKTIEYYEDK